MKAFYLCLLLLCISFTLHSQNLVPNGDFEEYYQLPDDQGQLENCKYWINPSQTTPDYFHSDAQASTGFQLPYTSFAKVEPYSGSGIVGFFNVCGELREYISVQLMQPLKKGKVYTLSFAYSNGSDDYFATCGSNYLGAFFSKSIPYGYNFPFPYTPQVEISHFCWDTAWQKESFIFVADDDYTTLTFGNFRSTEETTVIDMVIGETKGHSYFFLDKVELIEEDLEINIEMPNVITPNNDGANDTFQPLSSIGVSSYRLTILNQWGGILFETNDLSQGWDGQFNGNECTNGTYFWRVDFTDVIDTEHVKSGFLTLIR